MIQFKLDGTFTEDWGNKHFTGSWQADSDSSGVLVKRDDGYVLHYELDAVRDLVRDYFIERSGHKKIFGSRGNTYRLSNSVAATVVSNSSTSSSAASPPLPDRAPTVALTADQARAVVLISGDKGVGTGFLVKMKDGPVVITNQHVIANNPNLKITTSTGITITPIAYSGATDRDLAIIAIKDAGYSYLPLAPDVTAVSPGDEVITPGNSQGGAVMLNTDGKVLGIGPDRIEIDNPVYHGNSGGPVMAFKAGQVIGVVTEGVKVDNTDDLDKASFASRNSAIRGNMRYFALRVDNVPNWEALDWQTFQGETAFLDKFEQRSRCLDSYLSALTTATSTTTPSAAVNDADVNLWQQDDALVRANLQCCTHVIGADSGQQMEAARELIGSVSGIANDGISNIQNVNNFYSYDRQRARDELDYRQALLKDFEKVRDDVDIVGHLPRANK